MEKQKTLNSENNLMDIPENMEFQTTNETIQKDTLKAHVDPEKHLNYISMGYEIY